jgi:hypothetical protein
VPLVDPRTGYIDRAWYLFFLSLNNVATSVIDDSGLTFNSESIIASYDAALQALAQEVETQPLPVDLSAELIKQIQAAGLEDCCSGLLSQVAELQKQIEALNVLPSPSLGTVVAVTATAPVVSSGGIAPDISLAAGYGDTQNPYAAKTANYVLAGPTAGAAAVPTFRALVASDIPVLPYGDVFGPASATDNAVARFDSTTGKLIQNSVVTISDTGATTGITTLAASTSVTTPIVQASNSAGLSLKNASGTTQMSVGAGGGDNMSINVSTNLNGTNAQIDISPTGTGHVHIKPSGIGSVEVAPTNVGTIDNMTIGATTPKNASVVDLSVTGTLSFDAAQGTAGQVLTSAGTGVTPTWTTPVINTVSAPVTKTANFTVADGEAWLINNKSGSTCTVTLPAAASWTGRQLIFKNMQAQTLVSASSDVVPIDSTSAGTAILLAVVGNWATMVSDGTNWIIMQQAANNCLLLE